MPRISSPARRSGCPISIALELLGDPWSLLIVRDLMFKGLDTYSGFLQAGEGIATNVLSDRLARLERAGLVTRRRQAGDRRRVRYRLTAKGMDLAPVLVELVLWSARHERTDAPAAVVKAMRRDRERFLAGVRQAWAAQDAPD
ncbi:MAG: helix-turn-helix domain-containing protein [Steroidobacteraceae bacterium]